MNELSAYYGAKVSVKKSFSKTIFDGEEESFYRISLQCKDLKNYNPSVDIPASYCAWTCYSQLPESDRKLYNKYTVQFPFDNQQKSIDYTSDDLALVMQAKPQLDSVFAYYVRADYQSLEDKFIPEVKKDKRLPQFRKAIQNYDINYGRTTDMKIRGFQFMRFSQDSTSEFSERLVRFRVLQMREKKNLYTYVTVTTHTLNGFIVAIDAKE
ncbi:MAG: hypothetical protein ACKVU0_20535 [Saprospiraceae bacterium]